MASFLSWAEAGDVHSALKKPLEKALLGMVVTAPAKVMRDPKGTVRVSLKAQNKKKRAPMITQRAMDALLVKEKAKWEQANQ